MKRMENGVTEIMEGYHLGSTVAYNLLKNLVKRGYLLEKKEGRKATYKVI